MSANHSMPPVQAEVDAQLLEQGAFSPLELLFSSGRLFQGDYDAWRRREIEFLDTVLMGSPEKIREELEHAVRYARSLGLEAQPQEFHAVTGRPAEKPLRISAEPYWHQLIAGRYVPARQEPQMDLFVDNPVVALTTGVVRALVTRDLAEAQRHIDRLYEQAPNHADLPAFDRLLSALQQLALPNTETRDQSDLILEITPAARRLLGSHARELLAPLWRQVAEGLATTPFSPRAPTLHKSFALAQAQDWAGVQESVLAETKWWLHGTLCIRLTESAFHRRHRVEALGAWCRACWRAPKEVPHAVLRLRQPELTSLWEQFMDEEAEDDPLPAAPLTEADFPAWLLLHEPGLARQLTDELAGGDTPAEEGYRLVHRWLRSRREKRHEEEMAVRKLLQQRHAALFRLLKRTVVADEDAPR
jgi:hypothetical protein